MIDIRPFGTLGSADLGWLDARYHFSFARYVDRTRVGWGQLRVWNDDTIAPQSGFPPHPHQDMEIITYVRTGAITHEDSMGNHGRTEAGDVQVMSAGSGITHSEYNLENEATTLFQIWVLPDEVGGAPSWGTRKFPKADRSGEWSVLASGSAEDGALSIRADASILGAFLKSGEALTYKLTDGRHMYVVVAAGEVMLNGHRLGPRDAAAIVDEEDLQISCLSDTAEIVAAETQ